MKDRGGSLVRFYRMKLSTQMNIIAISLLIVICTIMTSFVFYQMQNGIKRSASLKAKSDLKLSYNFIDVKYPGHWNVRNGVLYKGDTPMEKNPGLDEIGIMTGDLFSLYHDDILISTSHLDPKYPIGSKLSDEIAEEVLIKGQTYYGEDKISGESYQMAYMPIKNQYGGIIGIWGVAVSQAFVNEILISMLPLYFVVLIINMIIIAVAFGLYTRRIQKRLQIITQAMEEAGQGDFTKTLALTSGDEIGQLTKSYNDMKSNLAEIIGQVRFASEQVAVSSDKLNASAHETTIQINQVTQSINEMAMGAEESVKGARDSAIAMQELVLGVQKIAEFSSIVTNESIQAANESERGNESVQKAVQQMDSIEKSVNDSALLTKQLGSRTQIIGQIAELITSISSQINLLSLNATIEAARAGEHGRGFAVVANEVRKLAEKSAQSAYEINELLKKIEEDTLQSASAMERVIIEVKAGKEIVHESGRTFQSILHAIQHVANKMEEISAITEEISSSSESIALTVDKTAHISEESYFSTQNIVAVSQEQLASMDMISSSANALKNMARELERLIYKFKIT